MPSHDLPEQLSPLNRYKPLVGDWAAFCTASTSPLPVTAWMHPLRPASIDQLRADGLAPETIPWHPGGIRFRESPDVIDSLSYRAGHFHIQEAAALIPVRLLDPRPGERILDLCAAPGNKTAEIAVAMENTGTVVANDQRKTRLSVVHTTMDRLGLVNVCTTARDGRNSAWPADHFDRVLADVPCSCDGTMRKHPSTAARTSDDARRHLSRTQESLLRSAIRTCRPGGRIVYATCSLAPEENEAVVSRVLRDADCPVRILPAAVPGIQADPGVASWNGEAFDPDVTRSLRIWPHHVDSGGFFVAVLEKTSASVQQNALSEPSDSRLSLPQRPDHPPDLSTLLELFADWYGLPDAWRSGLRFERKGARYLMAQALDLDADLPFTPLRSGVPFFRLSAHVPKPTTEAALMIAPMATRQVLRLDRRDTLKFMAGHALAAGAALSRGYVFVVGCGLPAGVGFFRDGMLESLYPRRWAGLSSPVSPIELQG